MHSLQIPANADQGPFALNGIQSTKQKLPESQHLFDNAKYGLNRGLPFRIIPTQRFVFTGIGFDFCPIQTDIPELDDLHCLCDQQNLDKKGRKLFQETLSEVGDRVMARVGICTDIVKGDQVLARFFLFAAGENTGRIAVKKNGDQDRGKR